MNLLTGLRRPASRPADAPGATAEPPVSAPMTERRVDPAVRLSRLALFWSAMGTSGPTEPFQESGKFVAAAGLSRALACHGRIGRIDVFAPLHELEKSRERFDGLPDELIGTDASVVRLLPESDLPDQLAAGGYDVLHDPCDLRLARLTYARSRFSHCLLPVTASVMGFSYSFNAAISCGQLLTVPLYPCDALVCATQSARAAFERRMGDVAVRYSRAWDRPAPPLPRLEVIPWGVDTQLFAPRDQSAARAELQLPLNRPIVLCSGRMRIHDKMDWTPILLAFERICRTSKQRPLLVLAGSWPTTYGREVVQNAASLGIGGRIRTFFDLPPACLPSLYAACDVYVSPSDTPGETFGLTLIEAMACGRPVVASDWDGYREVVVHGETGFLVRTDWADCLAELNLIGPILDPDHEHLHVGQSVSVDVAQMAAHITTLLDHPQLRHEMGRQAREHVMSRYDWAILVGKWEALWGELAAVARSLDGQPARPDRLEFLQPNHFHHFSGYATRIVDDAVPVVLTERGKALLAGRSPLLLHPWARGLLKPDILRAVLAALKAANWFGAGLPVGELLAVLRRSPGVGRDRALAHLMWLAKYDLVSLGGMDGVGAP